MEKDEIKALYLFRELYVEDISKTRIEFFKKEKIYFCNLKKYFYLKEFIISFLKNNLLKSLYEYIDNKMQYNIVYSYYKNFCLINLDNIWTEFYTNFIKERGNRNNILNNKEDYFLNFIEKIQIDWIDYLKELYTNNNNINLKNDLFSYAIKNIEEKYKKYKIKNDINDINGFKNFLSKLELKDLIN